jgi:integrase
MNKPKIKYVNFSDQWIRYHSQFIKESTYSNYRNIIDNHLAKDFTDFSLEDFSNNVLQNYVLTKYTSGSTNNNSLSIKTVKDIMVVLKLSLRYAFQEQVISSFDLSVKYPKTTMNRTLTTISKFEISKIIDTVKQSTDTRDIGILFGLLSGMRIGEICALKYSDISFKENNINVSRTLQRIYTKKDKTKIIETTPKTNSSFRTIPLSRELKALLSSHSNKTDNYILSDSNIPVEPRLLRKRFNSILKQCKIQHYTFHTLRHTFATKCIEAKIDYKTISVLLGHANISTTLNLYVHPNTTQKKRAINKLTAHMFK